MPRVIPKERGCQFSVQNRVDDCRCVYVCRGVSRSQSQGRPWASIPTTLLYYEGKNGIYKTHTGSQSEGKQDQEGLLRVLTQHSACCTTSAIHPKTKISRGYAREWCTVRLQLCGGESSAVVKPSAVDSEATNVRMISTQPIRSAVASVSTC